MIKIKAFRLTATQIQVDIEYDYDGAGFVETASANQNTILGADEAAVKAWVIDKVDGFRNSKLQAVADALLTPLIDVDLEAI